MGLAQYISKRVFANSNGKKGASSPIVKVAVFGVSLSILIIQLTFFIVSGFKTEIMNKIYSLQANYRLTQLLSESSSESYIPIDKNQLETISQNEDVQFISPFIESPIIIDYNGEISGGILKGVPISRIENYLDKYWVERDSLSTNGIYVSQRTCNKLGLKLKSKIQVFFVSGGSNFKNRLVKVAGIYSTGIEALDDRLSFIDLGEVQRILKPGVQVVPQKINEQEFTISLFGKIPVAEQTVFVNDSAVYFRRGQTELTLSQSTLSPNNSSAIVYSKSNENIYDTAWVNISTDEWLPGKGTHSQYATGYDVFTLEQFNPQTKDFLKQQAQHDQMIYSAAELTPSITNWLNFLNVNVILVVTILLIVAIVNMISALLVMVFEKTSTIGTLKTLGASNKLIQKVFSSYSVLLLALGLIGGNLLALLLGLVQDKFHVITLTEAQYLLDHVPIRFEWDTFVASNLLIFLFCWGVLWFPTYLITKIDPSITIKYKI